MNEHRMGSIRIYSNRASAIMKDSRVCTIGIDLYGGVPVTKDMGVRAIRIYSNSCIPIMIHYRMGAIRID
jgi:hypothetical protein